MVERTRSDQVSNRLVLTSELILIHSKSDEHQLDANMEVEMQGEMFEYWASLSSRPDRCLPTNW